MTDFIAALYIRLSKEDENKNECDNSESIENQKQILLKYIKENDYKLFDIYIDDGYTGTNFERPAFKKMINDIENKYINTVIVKDLSRLGRDYILTGYYTEMWFPKKGIRFISILDNIDSINEINELMPFKSLINDMYSKDNSKKIKAALRIKQQMGKWVGGCPPFGYMSDHLDKNHLVINEKEAYIVKKIFELFLDGNSVKEISNYLYKKNICTPNVIRNKKTNNNLKWSGTTIKTILMNQLYTGDMVQNRRKKVNYKIKTIIKNKENEWIIVENTHEKIIDKPVFCKVQELLNQKTNYRESNNSFYLSGLIYCFDCHKRMVMQKTKKNYYFMCNTYRKHSKEKLCTSHSFNLKLLEGKIIESLNYIMKLNHNKNKVIINRSNILKLIKKIEIHDDKKIDIYFNFFIPNNIAK